ncbi:hypothetical protein ACU8V4_06090 [Pseudoalteromonas mariniglutinosa]
MFKITKNIVLKNITGQGNMITANENVQVSASKGMHFKFYFNNKQITYDCSPVSGKEIVKIDGEIVSESKNYRFKSCHEFRVDNKTAKIKLQAKGLTKNITTCEFLVADKVVKAYQLTYGTQGKVPLMLHVLIAVIAAAIGWFYASQVISSWLAFGGALLLVALVLFKFEKPVWTCEELTQ